MPTFCNDLRTLLVNAKTAAASKDSAKIQKAQDDLDAFANQNPAPPDPLANIATGAEMSLGVATWKDVQKALDLWETARANYCAANPA